MLGGTCKGTTVGTSPAYGCSAQVATVAYLNEAKARTLGVSRRLLAAHGAVSEQTAREMAAGALAHSRAQVAVAITGIAGPAGGSPEKPVGTAFIGLATAVETIVLKVFNPYDRETFKQTTAQQALELLRRAILRSD